MALPTATPLTGRDTPRANTRASSATQNSEKPEFGGDSSSSPENGELGRATDVDTAIQTARRPALECRQNCRYIPSIEAANSPRETKMGLVQYSDNGFFAPRKIADAFRTTSEEIARTAGLGKDAVQRKDRVHSDKTQRRLREMVEVINKVEQRFGSSLMAYAWYRSEPLPGFSGQTAMQLVRSGRADDVLDYIDAVDAGVHA
jgi:uncharacterized protein (DUF2384 family)